MEGRRVLDFVVRRDLPYWRKKYKKITLYVNEKMEKMEVFNQYAIG